LPKPVLNVKAVFAVKIYMELQKKSCGEYDESIG
jgi:hypothetical protein